MEATISEVLAQCAVVLCLSACPLDVALARAIRDGEPADVIRFAAYAAAWPGRQSEKGTGRAAALVKWAMRVEEWPGSAIREAHIAILLKDVTSKGIG